MLKKKVKTIIIILAALTAVMTATTMAFEKIPLPPDLKISEPSPNLPQEVIALLGEWEGIWWNRTDSSLFWAASLVVEEIKGDKARIVYAWERVARINLKEGWERKEADFDLKTLTISWRNEERGLKFSFTLKGKTMQGLLEGKYMFDTKMKKKK